MKRIIFFLASLSQPRCVKRVIALHNEGFDVEVYGYNRGLYDVNKFPKEIKVNSWGVIENGNGYIKREFLNYKNIKKIVDSNPDALFYSFGMDLSFILAMLRTMYVYESSDLIYTYYKSTFLINVFKKIDKWIISNSFKTIFTSKGFLKYLYGDKYPSNVMVQPNKISPFFKSVPRKVLSNRIQKGCVFSYVGALRYPNTVFRFARIIGEKYPQHKFFFYGNSDLTYLAKQLSEKYVNIQYWGAFKNPEDLEAIYSSIDVVVACYDTTTVNERVAEPNKLYEAICFCRPIIVSKGTFLAERVSSLGVGFSIDAQVDKNIISFLDNLDYSQLLNISQKEKEITESIYLDSVIDISRALRLEKC